jgi:PAS domain S-box-containing protein
VAAETALTAPFKLHPGYAEEAIWALHEGEADAIVVRTPRGEDVYTLESINKPYRLFVEQMQEGAISICRDSRILYCNERFADMVGGLPESITGRTLDEFIAESALDDYRSLRDRGCSETARGECAIKHADGTTARVQLTFSQLRPHRIGHCAVVITDLTHVERQKELAAAMEAAEAANFAKDQFLAMLSHELRTPLNAVLGWAQVLRKGTARPDDTARGLEAIERNARMQMKLISDLLDVSRIISGKLRLEMQIVNLAEIAESACATVKHLAEEKGVHVECSIQDHTGLVSGDAGRLQQAIINLLNNGIKFTAAGGRVALSLRRTDGRVELTVIDSGEGIRPEFLPLLFNRFSQAGAQTKRNSGLGLGLFIVKQIVDMHGGSVAAFSAGPGKGATFTMRLPIVAVSEQALERRAAAAEAALRDEPGIAEVRLDGVRIIVVDDDADSLAVMEVALGERGAEVLTAASAAEAFTLITGSPPDLVISDLDMPVEDGFDLIRRVRRAGHSGRQLPAVALTAMARSEDRRRALLAGYQVHVAKPVDEEELVAAVAALVGRVAHV